jgi:NAD(P)-dependent dehydrogenase (short-subunit alcohol dehydrogenase family)
MRERHMEDPLSDTLIPTTDLISLKGKAAIVTGGARGIGRGIARRLADAGAAVLVTDLREELLAETVTLIREAGGQAEAMAADAASLADAERVAQAAVDRFGGLDIIVNNAAAFQPAEFIDITEAQYDQCLDIALKGVFFYGQAAARQMIKAGKGGRIVNIGSTDAFLPVGAMTHYDATKGGVVALTRGIAKELGRYGITCNAICPGGTDTPGAREAAGPIMKYLGLPEEGLDTKPRAALTRAGQPDDIARGVLFVASELGAYVTGAFILIDGGYVII